MINANTGFIEGRRRADGEVEVTVAGSRLNPGPSLELRNHSPTGFAWGYPGSGAAQLALAILLALGLKPIDAERYHQDFKRDFLVPLPAESFRLPIGLVARWIEEKVRSDG